MSPPPNEPLCLCVFGEDRAHWDAVTILTDRRIRDGVEWVRDLPPIEGDSLRSVRRWVRRSDDQPWFPLRRSEPSTHARFDRRLHGKRGPAASALRHAIVRLQQLVRDGFDPPDVVVFAMDVDGRTERVSSLRDELRERKFPYPIVLALPDPEAEAWIIALFRPATDEDRARHEGLRRELGFDPIREPHRLLSTTRVGDRDPKRVALALLHAKPASEVLESADISLVPDSTRAACGLEAFAAHVDREIVSRLDGIPRP